MQAGIEWGFYICDGLFISLQDLQTMLKKAGFKDPNY